MGEHFDNSSGDWKLAYIEAERDLTEPVLGSLIRRPVMTNGQCQITTLLRPGPLAHSFRYEEKLEGLKIEFEFEAMFVGGILSTVYQVFLGHALEKCPQYWSGSQQDNELLNHLMANIRQALCLLRSGPSEETRIKTVEFVLSRPSRWRSLLGFKSEEIVR